MIEHRAIGIGGIRARSEVKHETEAAPMRTKPRQKFFSLDAEFVSDRLPVPAFIRTGKVIDQDQVVVPLLVEIGGEHAADKAGGTRHHYALFHAAKVNPSRRSNRSTTLFRETIAHTQARTEVLR